MSTPATNARSPLSVMFVHAHPDDETTTTGATIARYAAAGARVSLVTCTRGEQGELVDPDVDPAAVTRYGGRTAPRTGAAAEQFGRLRSRELTRACRHLGIGPAQFLGGPGRWQDSGMAGTPTGPGTFAAADPHDCTRALAALIRTRRPQVMVAYDQDGGYGHPDHIRAHQITIAAVDNAADPRARPDDGTPWTVSRVLAAVVPHSALRAAARQLSTTPPHGANPFTVAEHGGPLPFGVPDDQVDIHIDATAHLPAKIAAMRAHRTQMHPQGWFFTLATQPGSTMGHEHYRFLRGDNRPRPAADDLFAGLP